MKRTLSILLALALLFTILPQVSLSAWAADETSGQCGDDLTWSFDTKSGTLAINGSGDMWDYTSDHQPWISYRESIKKVSLPEGMTNISAYAFSYLGNLTSVTIPNSVMSIGGGAFLNCSGLKRITIPGSVIDMQNKDLFEDYDIEEEEEKPVPGLFENCYSLTSVIFSEGVKEIPDGAFYNCSSLKSVTIPDGLTEIGDEAFFCCANLSEIKIPQSVNTIGSGAFFSCNGLESVTIPGGVKTIQSGRSVFEDDFSNTCPGAFEACDGLTSVIIEDGVENIGDYAFYKCKKLTTITIPKSMKTIGFGAFSCCDSLKNITIPGSEAIIKNGFRDDEGRYFPGAFESCSGLTGVIIEDGVKSIGDFAFQSCQNLTNVIIADSVEEIGFGVFFECSHLRSIKLPNKLKRIKGGEYQGEGLFYAGAFDGCSSLISVTIPPNVDEIGAGAFAGCSSLQSLTIQNGVQKICGFQFYDYDYPGAFYDCKSLTSVSIPESVKEIGDGAFAGCSNLQSVSIKNPKCKIGDDRSTLGDPKTSVIYGVKGSTAENYAKKYGYTFKEIGEETGFSDVSREAYYAGPVAWAVANGVTNGTSKTTFSPNNTCTRGQVATFLWRSQSSPAPAILQTAFIDLNDDAFYMNAVTWAVEKKITSGMDKTHFGPDLGCTRGQVVTFLWRAEGCPEPKSKDNPFVDVKEGAFYYKAVLWAVENKITNGMSANTFAPDATCTRGQIVTFLYRAVGGK